MVRWRTAAHGFSRFLIPGGTYRRLRGHQRMAARTPRPVVDRKGSGETGPSSINRSRTRTPSPALPNSPLRDQGRRLRRRRRPGLAGGLSGRRRPGRHCCTAHPPSPTLGSVAASASAPVCPVARPCSSTQRSVVHPALLRISRSTEQGGSLASSVNETATAFHPGRQTMWPRVGPLCRQPSDINITPANAEVVLGRGRGF